MAKKIRMADIAEKLDVSVVTVSKALADRDGVSEELRRTIKDLASTMGYTITAKQQPHAKEKRIGKTGNIGVLIPERFLDKTNSFYWELYERTVSRLMGEDYYAILEILKPEQESLNELPKMLRDNKIDGIIVIGQPLGSYGSFLHSLQGTPIMFLDSYDALNGNDSVISDGYYGMYAMTSHLIAMGHTDVIFVGTVNATSSISDRYFGYCRAMSENNIPVTPDMVLPDRRPGGLIEIKLPARMPTAFACNCDVTAYEMIMALKGKGLSVPDDVSIVGFDNYTLTMLPKPAITTYGVDMDGMARACVKGLLKKIANPKYSPNLKVVSGRLIEKDSVKRAARNTR